MPAPPDDPATSMGFACRGRGPYDWRPGPVFDLASSSPVRRRGADTLLLLEHPSVYTAGKRTEPHERPFDGTPVIDVDRGGKITWHGPGQLVGYPIVALPDPIDVVAYVRRLEEALIEVCAGFGLTDRPGRGSQRRLGGRRRPARSARAQGRRDRRPGRPRRHDARLRAQLRPGHDRRSAT